MLYYAAVTIKSFKAVVTKSGESDRSISEEKAQVKHQQLLGIKLPKLSELIYK